jgi:hypothetical protein
MSASTHNLKRRLSFALALAATAAVTACAFPETHTITLTDPCAAPWANNEADRHTNDTSPGDACAQDQNLRATVEHPSDLTEGRDMGPANGSRQAVIVERYVTGKPVEATPPSSSAMAPAALVPFPPPTSEVK